ncbi:hypothetical protein CE91St25_15330 [Campylobacter ureolyticus]|uniref:hypothetical protein n=1 Tax=Campylobacter ureolyticus TaxID=827 RepID=UPI001FC89007|nr:hypothetical protein [Campylobacter ureolyticus]GKH61197.1 hypothetical protein CE91St25_15330 [Campylobacter ureolyticus]
MNYESLGIYTKACEKVMELKTKRAGVSNELIRALKQTINAQHFIVLLDTKRLDFLVKELINTDKEMLTLISRANSVCNECNKPKIELKKPY